MTGDILLEMKLVDYAKECLAGMMEQTPCFFIEKDEVPWDRKKDATYGQIICNVLPQKDGVNRPRLTVGGDRINPEGDCSTPTANLPTVKLLMNSIVSTPGGNVWVWTLRIFYLNTPMDRPEYLKMKLANFPDDVIAHYKLKEKVTKDGFIFCKICKGMYGLPHTGLIAQQLLE